MKRILIIDDETDIVELVSYNLKKEGFDVDFAYDGEEGLKKITNRDYDLLILDIGLPGIQGLDLCKIVRGNPKVSHLPIIMLTARGEEIDRIIGLEIGADDYITKPFSPRELLARVKTVLRRALPKESPRPDGEEIKKHTMVKIRDIAINKETFTVEVGGRKVNLSATEFNLLLYFAERPEKVLHRDHILNAVWGRNVHVDSRTVDVHIRRLRKKIEKDPDNPQYIKTMRGIGYFMEK